MRAALLGFLTVLILGSIIGAGLAIGNRSSQGRQASSRARAELRGSSELRTAASDACESMALSASDSMLSFYGYKRDAASVHLKRLSVSQQGPTNAIISAEVEVSFALKDGNHGPIRDSLSLHMTRFDDGWRVVPNIEDAAASLVAISATSDLAKAAAMGGDGGLGSAIDMSVRLGEHASQRVAH